MDRQNVTLSLPKALLKKAKERQFKLLKSGFDLGTEGHITISKEELHARR